MKNTYKNIRIYVVVVNKNDFVFQKRYNNYYEIITGKEDVESVTSKRTR